MWSPKREARRFAAGFQEAGRLTEEMCVDGECYDLLIMEMFL